MKKILILLPGPFLKRDYERFGIETLKKNFLVKAVDCTAWFHPELWQEYSKIVFKSEDHVVISCKRDFLTLLNKINPVIVIDCLHDDKKTNWIRQQTKKNKKTPNICVGLRGTSRGVRAGPGRNVTFIYVCESCAGLRAVQTPRRGRSAPFGKVGYFSPKNLQGRYPTSRTVSIVSAAGRSRSGSRPRTAWSPWRSGSRASSFSESERGGLARLLAYLDQIGLWD